MEAFRRAQHPHPADPEVGENLRAESEGAEIGARIVLRERFAFVFAAVGIDPGDDLVRGLGRPQHDDDSAAFLGDPTQRIADRPPGIAAPAGGEIVERVVHVDPDEGRRFGRSISCRPRARSGILSSVRARKATSRNSPNSVGSRHSPTRSTVFSLSIRYLIRSAMVAELESVGLGESAPDRGAGPWSRPR